MTPQPPSPEKKKSTATIVIIVLVVLGGCCIVGGAIMAAIAIPNFIRYQARAKQAECRSILRGIYTAERSLFAEKNVYSENAEQAGLSVEGRNYVYVLGGGAPIGNAPNAAELAEAARSRAAGPLGVSGTCPQCSFTAACAGNIDKDGEPDVWSISTADRTAPNGRAIPAGELFNDFSDVTDSPGK